MSILLSANQIIQPGHETSQCQVVHEQMDEVELTHRKSHETQYHPAQKKQKQRRWQNMIAIVIPIANLATKQRVIKVYANDANDATLWNHGILSKVDDKQ